MKTNRQELLRRGAIYRTGQNHHGEVLTGWWYGYRFLARISTEALKRLLWLLNAGVESAKVKTPGNLIEE